MPILICFDSPIHIGVLMVLCICNSHSKGNILVQLVVLPIGNGNMDTIF